MIFYFVKQGFCIFSGLFCMDFFEVFIFGYDMDFCVIYFRIGILIYESNDPANPPNDLNPNLKLENLILIINHLNPLTPKIQRRTQICLQKPMLPKNMGRWIRCPITIKNRLVNGPRFTINTHDKCQYCCYKILGQNRL